MNATKPQSVFGTTEWRSYALYNAGTHCEERGDMASAEKLYIAALGVDAQNFAARMNLGALLLQSGSEMRGMEQLIIAKRGAFTDRRIENDAVYYSASMRLAAALYNAARHRDAYLEADSLLHEIHKSLAALAKPPLESPLGRLLEKVRRWPVITHLALRIENRQRAREIERLHPIRRYLEQLLPSVEIMHIGLGVACGQPVRPLLLGDRAWMPSAEYQYNLACTLSLMGARASETQLTAKFFNDALDHLGLALRLEHQMVNLARQDTSLCDLRNARRKEFRGILRRWTPPSPAVPALPKVAEAAETAPPTVSPPKGRRSSRPQRLQSL